MSGVHLDRAGRLADHRRRRRRGDRQSERAGAGAVPRTPEARRARAKTQKLKKTPAITKDGTEITLANIELPDDCAAMEAAPTAGLFRSEFLFMGRDTRSRPRTSSSSSTSKAVVAMKGRPVTIRTLDIGADKPLDQSEQTALNPGPGPARDPLLPGRAAMFLTQLRAILRASAFGKVRILIPMLAHAFEIDQSLAIAQGQGQLREQDQVRRDVEVGAMIEIPAAALALPMFVKRMDFLSIGTNDLIQYTLAIDRVDYEVAHLTIRCIRPCCS
jgi:phosphotransferase system enzyme I (PtsI)